MQCSTSYSRGTLVLILHSQTTDAMIQKLDITALYTVGMRLGLGGGGGRKRLLGWYNDRLKHLGLKKERRLEEEDGC